MTQIKICGITNLTDATVATDAGADLIGFIFYTRSPRFIAPERAREIVQSLRARATAPKFVGVFVNESLERVRAVMDLAQLDLAQLHGDEPPHTLRDLSPRAFKALRPRDANAARTAVEIFRDAVNSHCPAFLVDAFDAQQYGGTGQRTDWDIAAEIAREFPILLAGGLNPENVAAAIRAVAPWGIDVSSGVEREPGLKDHAKVRALIRAVKIFDALEIMMEKK